ASMRSIRRPSGWTMVTGSAYAEYPAGCPERDEHHLPARMLGGDPYTALTVRRGTLLSTIGRSSGTVTLRASSVVSEVTPAPAMPHGTILSKARRSQSQ